MPSVYYTRADGVIIRRVYRSIDELEATLAATVRGTSTLDFTQEDLEERLAAKRKALRETGKAPGSTLSYSGLAVLRRVENWFLKGTAQVASTYMVGLLGAYQDYVNAKVANGEEAQLDELLGQIRDEWQRYQSALASLWFAQRAENRLIEQREEAAKEEAIAAERATVVEGLLAKLESVKGKVKAVEWEKVAASLKAWGKKTAKKTAARTLEKQVDVLLDAVTNPRRKAALKR